MLPTLLCCKWYVENSVFFISITTGEWKLPKCLCCQNVFLKPLWMLSLALLHLAWRLHTLTSTIQPTTFHLLNPSFTVISWSETLLLWCFVSSPPLSLVLLHHISPHWASSFRSCCLCYLSLLDYCAFCSSFSFLSSHTKIKPSPFLHHLRTSLTTTTLSSVVFSSLPSAPKLHIQRSNHYLFLLSQSLTALIWCHTTICSTVFPDLSGRASDFRLCLCYLSSYISWFFDLYMNLDTQRSNHLPVFLSLSWSFSVIKSC